MNQDQLQELLLQSLTHEKGGVLVYETAIKCAINEDLRGEWEKYLEETTNHVRSLEKVCKTLGIDSSALTPGCEIVQDLGLSLVDAMNKALTNATPDAAQLVACECVVLAETKDHADWELIGKCAEFSEGKTAEVLKAAYDEIEDQEDEHLYHTKGWCRELWLQSLGLNAVLPPPEEVRQVKTAISAAKAEQESMLIREL